MTKLNGTRTLCQKELCVLGISLALSRFGTKPRLDPEFFTLHREGLRLKTSRTSTVQKHDWTLLVNFYVTGHRHKRKKEVFTFSSQFVKPWRDLRLELEWFQFEFDCFILCLVFNFQKKPIYLSPTTCQLVWLSRWQFRSGIINKYIDSSTA